ncbi:MAG: phosphatase PAP2 family protein [Alphaproteobacteria bacterium]
MRSRRANIAADARRQGGAPALAAGLGRGELAVVRIAARWGRTAPLRPLALLLNRLGNGWLYVALAAGLLLADPGRFPAVAGAATAAALLAHAVYPWIKRQVQRPRPFEADPALTPLLPTLDAFAFPSGHCMTVVAVLIPLCAAYPGLALPAALLGAAIAWARLVAAHHYPSDLVAGFALGAAVGLPMGMLLA